MALSNPHGGMISELAVTYSGWLLKHCAKKWEMDRAAQNDQMMVWQNDAHYKWDVGLAVPCRMRRKAWQR